VKIVDTTGTALTVYLTPDDCLLLAHACQIAFESTDNGDNTNTQEQTTEGALYHILTHLFEGYALVGQAISSLAPKERAGFDLAVIRSEWGVLSRDRRVS